MSEPISLAVGRVKLRDVDGPTGEFRPHRLLIKFREGYYPVECLTSVPVILPDQVLVVADDRNPYLVSELNRLRELKGE